MRVGYFATEKYYGPKETAGAVGLYLLFSAAGIMFIRMNEESKKKEMISG